MNTFVYEDKLCINEVAPISCHLAFFMFTHKAGSKWGLYSSDDLNSVG